MRTPPDIPDKVLAPDVDKYIREVRRIRRAEIRASITERAPGEEPLTLTEDERETYVDIIEALVKVAGYDPDTINQLIDELEPSPDGQLYTDQVLLSLESRVPPSPPMIDDATLALYDFEVTGKIFIRCTHCRRGQRKTEQQFKYYRFLQRQLLQPEPCPYCRTGQMKLYGVKAVLRDDAPSSQKRET